MLLLDLIIFDAGLPPSSSGVLGSIIVGMAPLAARGWTWSSNPAGMHLLVRHPDGDYVRAIAAASSLDMALLRSYRARPAPDDGLFLRFGGLGLASLRAGVAALVSAAHKGSRES